ADGPRPRHREHRRVPPFPRSERARAPGDRRGARDLPRVLVRQRVQGHPSRARRPRRARRRDDAQRAARTRALSTAPPRPPRARPAPARARTLARPRVFGRAAPTSATFAPRAKRYGTAVDVSLESHSVVPDARSRELSARTPPSSTRERDRAADGRSPNARRR